MLQKKKGKAFLCIAFLRFYTLPLSKPIVLQNRWRDKRAGEKRGRGTGEKRDYALTHLLHHLMRTNWVIVAALQGLKVQIAYERYLKYVDWMFYEKNT